MEREEGGKREEHSLEEDIVTVVSGQMTTEDINDILATQNSSETYSYDSGAQSDYEEEEPAARPRSDRRLSTFTANPFEIQGMTELRAVILDSGAEAAGAFDRVVHPRANLEAVRGVVDPDRDKDPIDSLHPNLEATVQVEKEVYDRAPEITEEDDVYASLPTPPEASSTALLSGGGAETEEEAAPEAGGKDEAVDEGARALEAPPVEVHHEAPAVVKKRNIFKRMFGKKKKTTEEPKTQE